MYIQLLKAARFENVLDELLGFITSQGKVSDQAGIGLSTNSKCSDEAAEIIIQTVDDNVNGASQQSLSI